MFLWQISKPANCLIKGGLRAFFFLSLSNSGLYRIKNAKASNLLKLDLEDCDIITLPPEIGLLTNLQELNLNNNELTRLPPEIGKLTNLKILNLRSNIIKALPPEIGQLTNLQELNLYNNQLVSLPKEIKQLTNLSKLDLEKNRFFSIPSEVLEINNLEELNLSYNSILIPSYGDIWRLTNLRKLNLNKTLLTILPPEIGKLTNLQELYFNNDHLNILPPEIGQLSNLKILHLRNAPITTFPSEIVELINLEELDLGYTRLTELPIEITRLTNLQKLFLDNNQLTILPPEIGGLNSLKVLYLHNNKLKNLAIEIGELIHLQKLVLDRNQLTDLPTQMANLTSLKILDLDGNKFIDFPQVILRLRNIEELYLAHNQLSALPSEIIQLTKLKKLELKNNPLETPPIEIANQGIDSIRNYFDFLESGEEKLYEAKLIIVGQGGAGKTCVAENLINKNIRLNVNNLATTRGIEIKGWKWPFKESEFKVNIWDFGGQEIYHATHQFFLTKRSLYIFVWEARKDEENMMSFDYWLNTVSLLSEKSPIIMVQNKIDERTAEIDEVNIRLAFNNVIFFHKVSCKENIGMDDLINIIKEKVIYLPHVGTKWPQAWSRIRETLENDTRDFINYSEYIKICARYKLSFQQADYLSSYLHDLGVILHFQDDMLLRNTVILNPEWGTSAVYKVLDTKKVIEQKGRFDINNLYDIWSEYPFEKHVDLLQLMMRFELCFKLNGADEYIIPELLSPERPNIYWEYNNNLRFEYVYKFMPAGIITRFIVRKHEMIEDECYWRFGVILRYEENTRALITSKPFERKICINVDGSESKELLAIIRNEFDYLHNTLNNPEVKEMIPCVCLTCQSDKNPHFFEYSTIKNYISKGKDKISCPTSVEDININYLLSGVEKMNNKEEKNQYIYAENLFINSEVNYNRFNINEINFDSLADELVKVLVEMQKSSLNTENIIEMGRVAEAQKAAKEGNKNKVIELLKGTGKWTFNMASNIGAKLAADVIKIIIGMP